MIALSELQEIFQAQKNQILEDYYTFLRFESVATDPQYKEQTFACANWLTSYLKNSGMEVELWETDNTPTLFATHTSNPQHETLLLYCHYDVQPIDPLSEWNSPPFEPTLRDQTVYARGASDNKGQCFYTITALKTLISHLKTLPINIKFLIEGEEESGSPGLYKLLAQKKEVLKADHLLIVDGGIREPNTPGITLGARGMSCVELTLQEALFDLHSGEHGGNAYNPNRALANLLTTLHDHNGRVTVEGFYDNVIDRTEEEKAHFALDFDPNTFHAQFGYTPTGMESGYSPVEARWFRPTLEINGLIGGYTGKGLKTVIPAKASAKISCRLVPNQDPAHIAKKLTAHLHTHCPQAIKLTVNTLPGSGKAFYTSATNKLAKIMSQSYQDVFQKPTEHLLCGGTIPIAAALSEVAGTEALLVGVALPTDQVHSPNEHFSLDRLENGFLTIAHALQLFD